MKLAEVFTTAEDNRMFLEDIINGMDDWVRVLDRNDNVLFMNRSMTETFGNEGLGMKCYHAIGRDHPCENCISRRSVFDGRPHRKQEHIDGSIYSVMSSPIKNKNGEILAVVEVLRNISEMRRIQDSLLNQQNRLMNDISMARKIQYSMLPREQENEKLRFSYTYIPCETIGGDYLDFFHIDSSHTGMLIADVKGHGIPASLLTVFVNSALDRETLSPSFALQSLFKDFNKNMFDSDLYITVFYSILNLEAMEMTYANAGHSGSPFIFGKDRFQILRSPGIPISNWTEKPGYSDRKANLIRGDHIFYYTDGIMEVQNNSRQQYGEERLLEILLKGGMDSKALLNTIINSAMDFACSDMKSQCDDITMAIVDIK